MTDERKAGMLENRILTKEETDKYMRELKKWLSEVKEAPAEEMTNFFTKRIREYDKVHLTNWPREYAHIADYFEDGLNCLLDIGCGTGLELDSLYQRFPDVKITGIDLSEAMLAELRNKYKGRDIELINGDYFNYPFEDNKYDAAMSFETLHHFKYEKKKRIYEKLYQTIKPGGYYIECDYMACCREEEAKDKILKIGADYV